jgi:hypothetical protein
LIAACFASEGRRRWAWFYGAAIPVVFAALAAVGFSMLRENRKERISRASWEWTLFRKPAPPL